MTEDWMVGWHHQFIEFEQALGDYEGEGRLLCSVYGVTKSQTWLSG